MPNSLYAQWRQGCGAMPFLHEQGESPPERLLQAVWQHQRLRRDRLRSLDGQKVRVLHPGFASREGGPDFRGAVIQVGDAPPRSGDVEVDIHAGGWRAHGHDRNPAFTNVILHVIWDGDQPALDFCRAAAADPGASAAPATLTLCDKLDAPLGELSRWLTSEPEDLVPAACGDSVAPPCAN